MLVIACGSSSARSGDEGTDVEPTPSGGRVETPGESDDAGRTLKVPSDSIRLEDTLSMPAPGTYVPDSAMADSMRQPQ